MTKYWLLDLDRCLIDTELMAEVFFKVVQTHSGISEANLEVGKREIEQSGGSFDAIQYVQGELRSRGDDKSFSLIEQDFVVKVKQVSGLLSGAEELLKKLSVSGIPHGILTYGGEQWQRMKLAATGLDGLPVYITDSPHKGSLISSWQQPSGEFKLPEELGGGSYAALVLVDDKAISFDGLPIQVGGYQVVPSDKIRPSQQGELPSHIRRVEALSSIDV